MATPMDDSYSAPSGETIYAGRKRDASNPFNLVAGELKSVHLNDLASLNRCPGDACWYSEASKQNGPWLNWNGGVFAPDFSEFGAMIFWGGGHGGYDGIETTVFDLTTRQWSVIGPSTPETDFLSLLDTTWCDLLHEGSYIVPASHTYCHPVYLSPAHGGGVRGSWCLPFNVYGPDHVNGVIGNAQPHAQDLDTGIWTRLTDNTLSLNLPSGPYGGCYIDKRGTLWVTPGQDSNQNARIDLTASSKTLQAVTSFWNPGYYFNPCYVAERDIMIAAYCSYSQTLIRIAGYDLVSGTPVPFTVTQNTDRHVNSSSQLGIDWCPDTGKFYLYEGGGQASLHTLTPPEDWISGTWTWGSETMGGEAPADLFEVTGVPPQGAQPYTKWKYNPILKCFMWSAGTVARQCTDGVTRTGAFQLYRPLGIS